MFRLESSDMTEKSVGWVFILAKSLQRVLVEVPLVDLK